MAAAQGIQPSWDAIPDELTVKLDLLNSEREARCIRHSFNGRDEEEMVPGWLTLNGQRGRRAVCVLAEDGMRYEVLDMDRQREESDDEEEEAEEAEEAGSA